ncbi:MAG TPA: M23 family metallopeptidase, partial [Humidesulfovibrio sp.]|uniref:M23 family metallopeptidase n=1 Tax=Humidesulfovibrio sp. TaxID=2910988 RepID=UPI002BB4930C
MSRIHILVPVLLLALVSLLPGAVSAGQGLGINYAAAANGESNPCPPLAGDESLGGLVPDEAATPCRDCAQVSSSFGTRRDPITRGRRFHKGVDITRPAGTEVYAWLGGVVLNAGRRGRYGLTVDILHGSGVVSRYAHLKRAAVAAGQDVEPGQVIGLVGRTGRTTGANLHFEIVQDGTRRDPSRLGIDFSRLVGPV